MIYKRPNPDTSPPVSRKKPEEEKIQIRINEYSTACVDENVGLDVLQSLLHLAEKAYDQNLSQNTPLKE